MTPYFWILIGMVVLSFVIYALYGITWDCERDPVVHAHVIRSVRSWFKWTIRSVVVYTASLFFCFFHLFSEFWIVVGIIAFTVYALNTLIGIWPIFDLWSIRESRNRFTA